MQNLFKDLEQLLLQYDDFNINGKLNKPKIEEQALALEPQLLKVLLGHNGLKKHFFQDVEGLMVFDKIKFQKFISNKQFLPDSYTQFKNKIGLTANSTYLTESKEVVLDFPYKDCVLQGCQDKEDAKRDEVFFNKTLAPDDIDMLLEPKVLTNFKKYDATGEHKVTNLTIKDNLIIKGNNLLALHSLLSVYRGKVKLIYIDPPYNTDNDSFKYNDKFNHSTWLTFMKNRLEVARELLTENGVLFVHLDYNEVHYCKILLDELFGRGFFINEIIWRRKQATSYGNSKFGITNDTILLYSRNETYCFNPTYSLDDENTQQYIKERFVYDDGDGRKYMKSPLVNSLYRPNLKYIFKGINPPKNGWLYSQERMQSLYDNGELIIPDDKDARIYRKIFLDTYKGQVIQNIWTDIPIVNPMAKEQTGFTTQKPEKLLERVINACSNEGDLVLDYHLGSGTTAAVAHKMGRQYIGIEQMDYIEDLAITRLKNVIGTVDDSKGLIETYKDFDASGISKSVNWQGGGSFIYCELKQNNQLWVDKVINAVDSDELLNIWQIMQDKAQLSYKIDVKAINNRVDDFKQLALEEQKQFLLEIIDKNQLYVNYTEIDDVDYKCCEEEKNLNSIFYGLK